MDLVKRADGGELGGVERRETVVGVFCMRKKIYFQ